MAVGASDQTGVRHTAKSPAAFRTIAEVAEELELPAHVLRFWETKFPQIRPLKRRGGRRYYRPEDVTLLRRIRRLLYNDGYTIKGVQRLLRETGVRHDDLGDRSDLPPPPEGEPSAAEAALDTTGDERSQREALRALLADLEALRALIDQSRR